MASPCADPQAPAWSGPDARVWSPPGLVEPLGTGRLPAVPGAAAAPAGAGRATAILSARPPAGGLWSCADLLVDLPVSWADVELLISIRLGQFVSDVQQISVGELATACRVTQAGSRLAGVLVGVRGRPFSELQVLAFPTARDHEAGTIGAWGWGDGAAQPADRAGRAVVDAYASPWQQRRPIVHQGAGAFALPIVPANPRGAGIGVSALDVSTDAPDAGVITLTARNVDSGLAFVFYEAAFTSSAPIRLSFGPPLRVPARHQLEASVTGLLPSQVRATIGVFDQ